MQRVASLALLAENRPVGVEVDGSKIVLVRDGDGVRAFSGTCPHAGAPLDEGAICHGRLICPWHKAMFDVRDGSLLEPPALEALRRYPVQIVGDDVMVAGQPIEVSAPTGSSLDDRVMVIVGAGAAGAAAAAALREFGFEGRVVLIGAEPGDPFDRTALSKFVLEGSMKPADVPPLWPHDFAVRHRIERLHDRVAAIDPSTKTLSLSSGATLGYDAVLLAPGATPRPLDVPGGAGAQVHLLRTRADAASILSGLSAGMRVVVVGGSFIGLEAASALRQQGFAVSVVSPYEIPFERVLGREVGSMLRRLHESHGVTFHANARVVAVGPGRVTLNSGEDVPADIVLAGVGVQPATGFAAGLLAEEGRLAEDGGLIVDRGMRVRDGIFAAGDAARFPFGDITLRIEHWRVAQQHARVAARNMLGGDARFEQAPFFWTYHYGRRFEVHGHPGAIDRVEIIGELDAQDFVARLFRGDTLVGLVGCQRDTELAALALEVSTGP